MASCGREDEEDIDTPLVARKPGVPAFVPATSTAAASACCSKETASNSGSCGSSGGGCSSGSCSTSSKAAMEVVPSQSAHDAAVSSRAVVPPPRVTKEVGVRSSRGAMCAKCHLVRAQVFAREVPCCAPCFRAMMVARIKQALRIRCGALVKTRVLVGVSGGTASSCLARIVSEVTAPHPKRLFFDFALVHVDESALAPEQERAEEFQQQIREAYAQYQVPFISVPLEEVLNLCGPDEFVPTPPAASASAASSSAAPTTASFTSLPSASLLSNRLALQTLFSTLKDSSDKADLLSLLRLRLLAHVARSQGYLHVLLGDNATRTGVRIFSDTAKGRGATVSIDSQFTEERFQATFVYPAREQTTQAMAMFNHFEGVQPVIRTTFTTASKKSSYSGTPGINKLSFDFLSMLDAKFVSTISNIVGTTTKLVLPEEYGAPVTQDSHCALCGRVRVRLESEENARTLHAGVSPKPRQNPASSTAAAAAPVAPTVDSPLAPEISRCYGCDALIREMGDGAILPGYVLSGVFLDHRAPVAVTLHASSPTKSVSTNESTYPLPWNATVHHTGGPMLSHAERAAANLKKTREREEREREAEAQAKADQDVDEHGSIKHGQLQKQTREDMAASFAEFMLEDE